MGKDGFLTPKAIANRQKAKGLQKLRWFCQMCQKQCRDANGFKCHKLSEGHQRMMKLFLENQGSILDSFSKEFEKCMMDLIRRRWRSKRVYANKVYNEYIQDKTHLHMNATVWPSLGAFVKHLGKAGLCKIDKTEKGWYVQYIDRDPEIMARQAKIEQKEKMEVTDENDEKIRLQKMEQYASEMGIETKEVEATELKKDPNEKIEFTFTARPVAEKKSLFFEAGVFHKVDPEKVKEEKPQQTISFFSTNNPSSTNSNASVNTNNNNGFGGLSFNIQNNPNNSAAKTSFNSSEGKKITSFSTTSAHVPKKAVPPKEEKKEAIAAKPAPSRDAEMDETKDHWIIPGLYVKILNKNIADGQFYGKKAVIQQVIDLYVAVVKMDTGIIIKIDQSHLETVIPAIGSKIAIVNGRFRGHIGTLQHVDFDRYKTKVLVEGKEIEKEYEEVCKI